MDDVQELINLFISKKDEQERLENELDKCNSILTKINSVLTLVWLDQRIHGHKVGNSSLFMSKDVFASLKSKKEFKKWAQATKVANKTVYELLFTETVNAMTLKGFIKDKINNKEEIPDSVNVVYVQKIKRKKINK